VKYLIVIEKTETGYSAHCPDPPDCEATGEDPRSVKWKIAEVIDDYLRYAPLHGVLPQPRYEADCVKVKEVKLEAPKKGVLATGCFLSKGDMRVYKGSRAVGDSQLASSLDKSEKRL
jgi:predicted RNase H-like HicB family nuclease